MAPVRSASSRLAVRSASSSSMVWPRRRAAGRWWLFGLYSSYLVLGIPALAHRVAAPLAFQPQATIGKVDALIVFGGDNSVGRVRETLRLWRTHAPAVVIVSGEPWFVERLTEAGIPSRPDATRPGVIDDPGAGRVP